MINEQKLHTFLDRARNWLLLGTGVALITSHYKIGASMLAVFFVTIAVDSFFVLRKIWKEP